MSANALSLQCVTMPLTLPESTGASARGPMVPMAWTPEVQ